jgi:hypothetical protein
MSSVDGGRVRRAESDNELGKWKSASNWPRVNLRPLMDVVFGVAALALLLAWLVLSIAGGRLT